MPKVLLESDKVSLSARKEMVRFANSLGVKGEFQRFDSLMGRERGANRNHIVAVFKREREREERIGIKVCDRCDDPGMTECEAAISDIDYIMGLDVVPRTVFARRLDKNFPDDFSNSPAALSRWESKAQHVADMRPIETETEAIHYAFQAGKIAFLIEAFLISDRHGENFVWNSDERRLVMIDNECAFGYGDGAGSIIHPIKKYLRRRDRDVRRLCKCSACRALRAEVNEPEPVEPVANDAIEPVRESFIKGIRFAFDAFEANKAAIINALKRYSYYSIKGAVNRALIFSAPNKVLDRLLRDAQSM